MQAFFTIIFFLCLCFESAFAKCTSFSFGVNSVQKSEFAFFECQSKQVFQNSDLFNLSRKSSTFFIGESVLSKKVNFKKINKALKTIIKRSKKQDLKKMFKSHELHLTIGNESYLIDFKSLKALKKILGYLKKNSQPSNGALVKDKSFFQIQNRKNMGPISALKIKTLKDSYFFSGLYWSK